MLPTRDLVIQVRETFEAVCKGRGLKARNLLILSTVPIFTPAWSAKDWGRHWAAFFSTRASAISRRAVHSVSSCRFCPSRDYGAGTDHVPFRPFALPPLTVCRPCRCMIRAPSRLQGGSSKVDILICTPGRLIDHLEGTPNFTLQHLRFLVCLCNILSVAPLHHSGARLTFHAQRCIVDHPSLSFLGDR